MRVFAALLLLALACPGGLASADIPPPPDFYSGPRSADIAGLEFVRQSNVPTVSADPLPVSLADIYIFLTDCTASRPNCRLVKGQKVLGYVVRAINGAPVQNDLGAFQSAFNATPKGHKVILTLATPENVEPARQIDITFDRT